MISLPPVVAHKDLVLKKISQPIKSCAICFKPPHSLNASSCADCLYPYDNQQFFSAFDYFDYLEYQAVNSSKARNFFINNADLKPCAFCGGDSVLQSKSISIYDRYYPAEKNECPKYKDSLSVELFYLTCTGCTFSTEYLYLYEFYVFYHALINAWNNGKSRLPLIKYSDLRLPEWSINFQLLKTVKKYAAEYQEKFSPQQSLFDDPPPLSKQQQAAVTLANMLNLYALYG